jgi:hypothetical protein
MAEEESVNITTGLFGLKLTGANVIVVLLFIALMTLTGLTMWEHVQRSLEHDQITCMIKLNLYMQQQPSEGAIDWRKIPVDLYACIPQFMYKSRGE